MLIIGILCKKLVSSLTFDLFIFNENARFCGFKYFPILIIRECAK